MGNRKIYHRLERLVRGFSNHRRIEILDLLDKKPELSVMDIAVELDINLKTGSEHIRRLAVAGLVAKRSDGSCIRHKLTPAGKSILKFLRTLE
jgi:DNA-binding MarR family transcriptional regulator